MTPRKIRGAAERMRGYARVKEARSPRTTAERLRELAGDEITPVRYYTALNPTAPPDVLLRLVSDQEHGVRWCALLNRGADEAVFRAGIDRERAESAGWTRRPSYAVRGHVLHQPGVPQSLRAELLAEDFCRCPEHRPRTALGELFHRLRRAGRRP